MNSSLKPATDSRIILFCLFAAIVIVVFFLSIGAEAQPPLPNVLPDGVDADDDDPVNMLVQIIKYIVAVVLWLGVLYAGLKVIWEAIGDIRDAKNGDTKWIAAGKSIASGIFLFLVVLAIALWLTNQFLV